MRFYIWFAAEAKRGCFKRKHRPERKALSSDKIETRTRLTKLTKKQRSIFFFFSRCGGGQDAFDKKEEKFHSCFGSSINETYYGDLLRVSFS
jgi:hypothetical protein